LTDGQRTTGVDPLDAAKLAADRGVRVYTVGIGTVDGETIGFEGWSMRVRLDEDTLSSRLTVEKKETEISALFALGAALLALLSAGLSIFWFNRIL
ncbi:MAG: VWA domain-containing protein, partial [Comamonadaceae bacterium]